MIPNPFQVLVRPLTVAVCVLLLAACSLPRVAYNNAEILVRHKAGDYLDFNPDQSEDLKARIERFHHWHRANELPVYASLMRNAGERVSKGLIPDDVAWGWTALRTRYRLLASKAAEDIAPLLATLSPEQVNTLEKRLAERNAKYAREMLPKDEKKRARAHGKKMLNQFEDWMGALSDAQEARIEAFAHSHTRYVALRFEDRQRWQREGVALLRQGLPARELSRRLPDLFTDPGDRRSPEFRQEERRWEEDMTRLLIDLDRSLTPPQRTHVVKRMEGYAEDFIVLASSSGRRT